MPPVLSCFSFLLAEVMKRNERKNEERRLRVLRAGESLLVSHTIRELEIVLYRPVQRGDSVQSPNTADDGTPSEPPAAVAEGEVGERPLFFDTAACFFLDGAGKVDYVTPGHTGISTQGATYLPHAVVTGQESGMHHAGLLSAPVPSAEDGAESLWTCTSPLAPPSYTVKPNGALMAPGDGVLLDLNGLSACAGALVCATLFTPGVLLSHVINTFYVVRRPKTATPLCFVPVSVTSVACNSGVSLMLRHVRVKGEVSWEIVNVAEGLEHTDIKKVLRALQMRGLRDPSGYSGGATLATDDTSDSSDNDVCAAESSSSQNDQLPDDLTSQPGAEAETPRTVLKAAEPSFTHTPRLVRCGKHQYNVGRSAARADSTSEEDEAMDDVLRAVVPQYAAGEVVRYESGTYNVGSRPTTLAAHYVEYREHYAVEAADTTTRDSTTTRKSGFGSKSNSIGPVSHLAPSAVAESHRDSDAVPQDSASWRPDVPFELLSPSARAVAMGAQHSREGTSPRQRTSHSRSRSHSNVKKKKGSKKSSKTTTNGASSLADDAKSKAPPPGRRSGSAQRAMPANPKRSRSSGRRKPPTRGSQAAM